MSLYSLSSRLRRGQEAVERPVRFVLAMAQLSPLIAVSAPALLAPPAGLARDGSSLLPPSPERREPTLLMANPWLRTCPHPLS